MKINFRFLGLVFSFMISMNSLFAQIPNCAGNDSSLLFLLNGTNIMAYDPAQPLSASNPFQYLANGLSYGGLTISNNLVGGSPSPAFFSTYASVYKYYDGATWVSTGHSVPIGGFVSPGGGINAIFNINAGTGEIVKYDGTSNATSLFFTYPNSGPYDLVVDNQDNIYHLVSSTSPGKINKYSPTGLAIDSFIVNGNPAGATGGGFGIIGNMVYCVFNTNPSFYAGPIIGGVVNLVPLGNVFASDVATCPLSMPSISSIPNPIADFSISNDTICAGTCIQFTDMSLNSPSSWTWSFPTGSPSSSILPNPPAVCFNTAGNHVIQLIVSNGTGSDTITKIIHVDQLGTPSVIGDKDICLGEITTLTVNPIAQHYSWSTGILTQSITLTPTMTSTYTVVLTEGACSDSTSATVVVHPLPVINLQSYMTGCNNNTGSIVSTTTNGTSPYTYNWSNGQSGADAVNLSTGNYSVTVTDANSCTATSSTTVFMMPNPVATITPMSTTILFGDTLQLKASGAKYYSWSPSNYLNSPTSDSTKAFPKESTAYCVVVSDEYDCKDTICMNIEVRYCEDFFIPNAFTPNHDGLNDNFFIKGSCISQYSMKIANRWGNIIYTSQNDRGYWDGTYKNVDEDAGTYYYYAKIDFTYIHFILLACCQN
jgi:gliding motility-associated-like protein